MQQFIAKAKLCFQPSSKVFIYENAEGYYYTYMKHQFFLEDKFIGEYNSMAELIEGLKAVR